MRNLPKAESEWKQLEDAKCLPVGSALLTRCVGGPKDVTHIAHACICSGDTGRTGALFAASMESVSNAIFCSMRAAQGALISFSSALHF
jgi:hypothetical protein